MSKLAEYFDDCSDSLSRHCLVEFDSYNAVLSVETHDLPATLSVCSLPHNFSSGNGPGLGDETTSFDLKRHSFDICVLIPTR